MSRRLVEWDGLDVRIDGDKIRAMVAGFRLHPIEKLDLQFTNGLLRVSGVVRKFLAVPFSAEIREIEAKGRSVRVPLRAAAAFGGIPIPQFLFGLVKGQLPATLVQFEEPATFIVSLDRFLPSFVDVELQKVWIIDGGLAVTLGRGGADLPPSQEETHGTDINDTA
ncbi:MAG: hypothetical protein ABIP63_05025 [Thermoanaerobaculia bacterium]